MDSDNKMKENNTILLELNELAPALAKRERKSPFVVPANYFEESLQAIVAKVAHPTLEKTVLPLPKTPSFAAPDGYFNGLADQVLQQIKAQSEPTASIAFGTKTNAFSTPEGYFEGLSDQLINRIQQHPEVEPILTANKRGAFTTPDGYFDTLADLTIHKIKHTGNANVVRWYSVQTIRRIAVAAAIVGVLFGSVWVIQLKSESANSDKLTAQEISTFIDNNSEELDEQVMMEAHTDKPVSTAAKTAAEDEQTKNEYIDNEVDENMLNELL